MEYNTPDKPDEMDARRTLHEQQVAVDPADDRSYSAIAEALGIAVLAAADESSDLWPS